MVYTGSEISEEDLFHEVREIALRERISDISQYKEIIDEVVESKRLYGFFSEDEDLVQVKENLESRWKDIQGEIKDNNKIDLPT